MAYSSGNDNTPAQLKFQSSLNADHKMSVSKLPINLKIQNAPLDGASFFSKNLERELKARGVAFEFNSTSSTVVDLKKVQVLSHRVSGFSPMVTITYVQADLRTNEGSTRIASMVKRAKLPVWSMDEVNEPCYSQPLELVVREMAAKISAQLSDYALTDDQVDALIQKIRSQGDANGLAYYDVYELGFSNNPRAVDALKEFAGSKDDYVRMAAISGLGILGDTASFDFLKQIYSNNRLWQDRGMALKSIGDLGSEAALAFLKQEKSRWQQKSSNEANWNTEIINLYLD